MGERKGRIGSSCVCCCLKQCSAVKSATDIENEIRMEYQYKLKLDDTTISDPYLIAAVWSNEQSHISERNIIFGVL